MANTVRTCDACGAQHLKVFCWKDSEQKEFYFCNMDCKKHFFEVLWPKLVKERLDAENQPSVLPEVRKLIAYKDKNGCVTFVRGNGTF